MGLLSMIRRNGQLSELQEKAYQEYDLVPVIGADYGRYYVVQRQDDGVRVYQVRRDDQGDWYRSKYYCVFFDDEYVRPVDSLYGFVKMIEAKHGEERFLEYANGSSCEKYWYGNQAFKNLMDEYFGLEVKP